MNTKSFVIDNRLTQLHTFPNGFRCAIIRDLELTQAFCCLRVDVGQVHDPPHLLGLSHLIEHALPLSSRKYPEVGTLSRKLVQQNGAYNALTAATYTNYHFSISQDHFTDALDMFLACFEEPLFPPQTIENEIKVVDLEHQRNVVDSDRRIYEVRRKLSNKESPYHRLDLGCVTCLTKPEIRPDLLAFHKRYYVPNSMILLIVSSYSTSDILAMVTASKLTTMVVPADETIPKFDLESQVIPDEPGDTMIHLNSTTDETILQMSWCLGTIHLNPNEQVIIQGLLCGDHPLGLKGQLAMKSLIKDLRLEILYELQKFTLLDLKFSLSEMGIASMGSIVEATVKYIHYLRENSLNVREYATKIHQVQVNAVNEVALVKTIEYANGIAALDLSNPTDPYQKDVDQTHYNLIKALDDIELNKTRFLLMAPFKDKVYDVADTHDNLSYSVVPVPDDWKKLINANVEDEVIGNVPEFQLPKLDDSIHISQSVSPNRSRASSTLIPEGSCDWMPNATYFEITSGEYKTFFFRFRFFFEDLGEARHCKCLIRRYMNLIEQEILLWMKNTYPPEVIGSLSIIAKSEGEMLALLIDGISEHTMDICQAALSRLIEIASIPVTQLPPLPEIIPPQRPPLPPVTDMILKVTQVVAKSAEESCPFQHQPLDYEHVTIRYVQIMATGPVAIKTVKNPIKKILVKLAEYNEAHFAIAPPRKTSDADHPTEPQFKEDDPKRYLPKSIKFIYLAPFELELIENPAELALKKQEGQTHICLFTFVPGPVGMKTHVGMLILKQYLHPIISQRLRYPEPLSYAVETTLVPTQIALTLMTYAQCPNNLVPKVKEVIMQASLELVQDPKASEEFRNAFEAVKKTILGEVKLQVKTQNDLMSFVWQNVRFGTTNISDEIDDLFAEDSDLSFDDMTVLLEKMFVSQRKSIVTQI